MDLEWGIHYSFLIGILCNFIVVINGFGASGISEVAALKALVPAKVGTLLVVQ